MNYSANPFVMIGEESFAPIKWEIGKDPKEVKAIGYYGDSTQTRSLESLQGFYTRLRDAVE